MLDSREALTRRYASSSVLVKSAWESTCEAVAASVSANRKMALVVLEIPINQLSRGSMLLPLFRSGKVPQRAHRLENEYPTWPPRGRIPRHLPSMHYIA